MFLVAPKLPLFLASLKVAPTIANKKSVGDITDVWHLWITFKVGEFLSVGDLLNFIRAAYPGLFDGKIGLRPGINRYREIIDKLPIIGHSTTVFTDAVAKRASKAIGPLYRSAFVRFPSDAICGYCLIFRMSASNLDFLRRACSELLEALFHGPKCRTLSCTNPRVQTISVVSHAHSIFLAVWNSSWSLQLREVGGDERSSLVFQRSLPFRRDFFFFF
jgi:hypothetical protein